jgi:transposase
MERGAVFMPKGKPNQQYTGDFKQKVVEDMRENGLSVRVAAEKYGASKSQINQWERIYLEEGLTAFYEERRGRARGSKGQGRPPKLGKKVEEDLIAENQRLRMENDYLKKLNALVQENQLRNRKRR